MDSAVVVDEDDDAVPIPEVAGEELAKLSAGQVKTMLAKKQFKAVDGDKFDRKNSSDVWLHFKIIVDENERSVRYCQCKKCDTLYKCGRGIGTTPLRNHIIKCKGVVGAVGSTPPITLFAKSKKISLSDADKQVIKHALIYYCAKDLRPFESVKGAGFRNLLATVIKIASKVGEISVDDLLIDPTTISRGLEEEAVTLKARMKQEVEEIFTKYGGGITTDFWTDDHKKISYYAITAYYFTSDWKQKNVLLGMYEWDSEKRHTGENIRPVLYEKLKEYGINQILLKNIIFVTDQGSNLVKALQRETRLSCCAHILNNVLKIVSSNKADSTIVACIDSCKSLVTYFKQSGLKNKLKGGQLHQDCDTRWYSKVDMLESIFKLWDEVEELLLNHKKGTDEEGVEVECLNAIDKELVEDLQKLLMPFKEKILTMERSSTPTLPYVWLMYFQLRQHLSNKIEKNGKPERDAIKQLRCTLMDALDEKWIILMEYKVATFLHPSFKALNFENYDSTVQFFEKQEIIRTVRSLASNVLLDEENNVAVPSLVAANGETMKKRSADDEFLDSFGPKRRCVTPGNDEVENYLEEDSDRIKAADLGRWWDEKSKIYPQLSALARKFLAIPATSAASESVFSKAGLTITNLRSSLNPETAGHILFLHRNDC